MTTPSDSLLAIASAVGGCEAAVLNGDVVSAAGRVAEETGLAAALPALVDRLLGQAGAPPNAVAVLVGPGSFTGLRAGLAVAAGIGLALDVPVIGVTVAEALAATLPGAPPAAWQGRNMWTCVHARTGRVHIDRGGDGREGFTAWATDALPPAAGPVALCGNAANLVGAALAARGTDVLLTGLRSATPAGVAAVARRRLAGTLAPLPALPLYVDAPEARLPAGLRQAPGGP